MTLCVIPDISLGCSGVIVKLELMYKTCQSSRRREISPGDFRHQFNQCHLEVDVLLPLSRAACPILCCPSAPSARVHRSSPQQHKNLLKNLHFEELAG